MQYIYLPAVQAIYIFTLCSRGFCSSEFWTHFVHVTLEYNEWVLSMCCQNSTRGILSIRKSLMLSLFLTLKFRLLHSGICSLLVIVWCHSTGCTSQVSWAPFPATASLFTFLYNISKVGASSDIQLYIPIVANDKQVVHAFCLYMYPTPDHRWSNVF